MQKSFLRETAGVLMRAIIIVLTIISVVLIGAALYEAEASISDGSCNIAVLPVEGVILPYHGLGDFDLVVTPETIEAFMDTAEDDEHIDAVLVEINSPGGTPVASARIAERFHQSSLPIVGLTGDMAASGGYLVAAASDHLIASPMSDIGSIGVDMSFVEESEKNQEEGLTYVQLTTGAYKDIGNPNRPVTAAERELLLADLDLVLQEFIDLVSEYRGVPREEIATLADGASMPGVRAVEVNLVDGLGSRSEARQVLANILEIESDAVTFCEYRDSFLSL